MQKIILFTLLALCAFSFNVEGDSALEKNQKCERQECLKPKRWSYSKCQCECPKQSRCHAVDQIFNDETCEWCQKKDCGENKVNDNKCNCVCKNRKPSIGGMKWNDETCKLEKMCDEALASTCGENKTFDPKVCGCVCQDPMPSNIPAGMKWNDETCKLEKACDEALASTCGDNKTFDSEVCGCVCKNQKRSIAGMRWNDETCKLEKACDEALASTCGENKTFDTKVCGCVCQDPMPNNIPAGMKWNDETCKLEKQCDEEVISCEDNKTFDSEVCGCVCQDPMPSNIPAGMRWNINACKLEAM